LFYEYFLGDNDASHQTGRTRIIARAMHLYATTTFEQALAVGKAAAVTEIRESVRTADVKAGSS
jgi:hypothetical protein